MAGPGGGPSRRSHTKSRKGCKTCKRRHIRCDETFPQCKNCTKHQVRCDYMDSPTLASPESPKSPRQPNLLWTPEIETTVDVWRQSGQFPFPQLRVYPEPAWHNYSKADLRLIHHLSSISNEMFRNGTSRMTIWTENMPKFLSLAASHPFVMHSILAFSASHLAYISQSSETRNLAGHYGGVALKGLDEAMHTFSKLNADAVLASALLLQWQANDWRGWASLVTSTLNVISAMQPWKHESIFQDVIAEYGIDATSTYKNPVSSFVTQEARREHLSTLQNIHNSLLRLQPYLSRYDQESKWIEQLKNYVERLRASNAPQSPEEQFNQMYALRKWLFWVPISLLANRRGDTMVMMVLAYFYSTALSLEPMFPDVGSVLCSNFALQPLEEIIRAVGAAQTYSPTTQAAVASLDFSRDAAESYRRRKDWARHHAEGLEPTQNSYPPIETSSLELDSSYPHYTYGSTTQSLSPAFAPSPLSFLPNPVGSGQTSPYLDVPRHSIDFSGMTTAPGAPTGYISPTSPSVPPPLPSPFAYAAVSGPDESSFNFAAPLGYGGLVLTPTVWTSQIRG